jgi:hypothetical protein
LILIEGSKIYIMETCKTCKHWTQKSHYESTTNYGKCLELKHNEKVDIILQLGWDGGYVDYIETDEDFGCICHQIKE